MYTRKRIQQIHHHITRSANQSWMDNPTKPISKTRPNRKLFYDSPSSHHSPGQELTHFITLYTTISYMVHPRPNPPCLFSTTLNKHHNKTLLHNYILTLTPFQGNLRKPALHSTIHLHKTLQLHNLKELYKPSTPFYLRTIARIPIPRPTRLGASYSLNYKSNSTHIICSICNPYLIFTPPFTLFSPLNKKAIRLPATQQLSYYAHIPQLYTLNTFFTPHNKHKGTSTRESCLNYNSKAKSTGSSYLTLIFLLPYNSAKVSYTCNRLLTTLLNKLIYLFFQIYTSNGSLTQKLQFE